MDAKFNWGGNGATLSRMKRLEAMLPVSDAGIPDYEYMSEYIFQKRKTLLGKYRNHLVQRIKELGEGGEIPSIAQKKWDSFLISDIFSILPGKRLVSAHSTPAILQQKSKFGYLYKFNAERMANTKIMLPVTDDGAPDYEYMEQYAKNLMLRKYKQYLSYLDSKEKTDTVATDN